MKNGQKRLTIEEQREIVGRSRTLHERLEGPKNTAEKEPPIDPDQVLAEWKDRFPDEGSFRSRLEHGGLSEETVREQVLATHWPADEPLPEWIGTLESVIDHVGTSTVGNHEISTEPEETPFVELLAVIADYARERLLEHDKTLPMDAMSPMVKGLISQLHILCVRPLYVEFKSFVEYHEPDLATADPDAYSDPPTTLYEQFIDAMFNHGFKNLCLEYPVLARYMVQVLDHWTDAVIELWQRLESDREALQKRFAVDGDVMMFEPLSEDAHANGRLPVRVFFETGEIIYKPRPVDGGAAFYTILDRLEDHLSVPAIRTPVYLPRGEYGWMEVVEYNDLPNEEAAKSYYERAGAVLCTAYILNFTDCQFENLIADGSDPMIIDGETVFHPHVESSAKPVPTEIAETIDQSILLTALVPWSTGDPRKQDGEGMAAIAGLGSKSDRTKIANRSLPKVEAVNTDVMSVGEKQMEVGLSTNTPSIDDQDHPPNEYVDSIVRGFEDAYETINGLHADEQFLAEIADLELLDGIENRLVYRATMQYSSIRRSSAARNPLRDGVRLTIEFENLVVPFFSESVKSDRHWGIYEAERRSLRRFDIPRFTSRPNQRTVYHDGELLDVKTDASGYDRCRRRLNRMSAADRHRQTWLIREIFGTESSMEAVPPSINVSDDLLVQEAIALFDDVINASIDTTDGRGWVSIVPTGSNINLIPASYSVFWGTGGIALTAAALYEVTGEKRYRRLTKETLDPIVEAISEDRLSTGLGGTKGIGSIVYTLSVVSELFDENWYRQAALKATRSVTEDRLASDDTFDIMEGAAGTLLGLLAYYDRYEETSVLERAVACGERLLEARISVDGYWVWKTSDDTPLTGFSHGSSGIAYALARLATTANEPKFAEAAREAIEFEETQYSQSRNNWAKGYGLDTYEDRWCHGRSGMALARIGIGEHLGDDSLIDDANDALSETAVTASSHLDNVCCGNLGRAEALLVGARRADGDFTDATELIGQCLARRQREGVLSLPAHSQSFVNPTFFDGVTGAAYTLLRNRNPDSLPCVLLLE